MALGGNVHVRYPGDNATKVLFTLANLHGANVTSFGLDACRVTEGVAGVLA